MKRELRTYDREFKENAVKLVLEGHKPHTEVAKSLGIPGSTLSYWLWQYQQDPKHCFPGRGYLKPQDEELHRLHKELADVKMERDILKKAMAIFSRNGK